MKFQRERERDLLNLEQDPLINNLLIKKIQHNIQMKISLMNKKFIEKGQKIMKQSSRKIIMDISTMMFKHEI